MATWYLVSPDPIGNESRRLVETEEGVKGYATVVRRAGSGAFAGQAIGLNECVYAEDCVYDEHGAEISEPTRRVLDNSPIFA